MEMEQDLMDKVVEQVEEEEEEEEEEGGDRKMVVGIHKIYDLSGITNEILEDVHNLEDIFDTLVEFGNLKVVGKKMYQFSPYGASGIYLLEESHLSFHTFVDEGIITVDLFSCDIEGTDWDNFEKELKNIFKPKNMDIIEINRGENI